MEKIDIIQQKIIQRPELEKKIAYWRFMGFQVVFTNGCFDILHRGHIEYLAKASDLGDVLVVGLNTDKSVKQIKGDSRPLQDGYSRSLGLASLDFVDRVVFFDEETPYELIDFIKPDILVKGSEYKEADIVGADIIKQNGGKIMTIDMVEGYSTTKIIAKAQK